MPTEAAAIGALSRIVDRLVNTTAARTVPVARPEVVEFHRRIPVVDLLVGSVLFRRQFLDRRIHGHADLPRLQQAGVDLVGLTIATRHPDLRGTLSGPQFLSLGVPVRSLRSNMAIAEFLVRRIRGWAEASDRLLRLTDLVSGAAAAPRPGGSVGAFIGVQGGHVLDGDLRNVGRLRELGVRMLAPAHVMDNALVGSNTGVRRGSLTAFGREVVEELQRQRIVVDLAHMSSAGIREALPLLSRPFVVSHTGFTALSGRRGRRRFSPANRNLSTTDLHLVGAAGGVVGVVCSTLLVGGEGVGDVVDSFRFAVDQVGPQAVALGSDFDGALRMPFDVTGLPLLTQGLLDGGLDGQDVAAVMGGNALRVLGDAGGQ